MRMADQGCMGCIGLAFIQQRLQSARRPIQEIRFDAVCHLFSFYQKKLLAASSWLLALFGELELVWPHIQQTKTAAGADAQMFFKCLTQPRRAGLLGTSKLVPRYMSRWW